MPAGTVRLQRTIIKWTGWMATILTQGGVEADEVSLS